MAKRNRNVPVGMTRSPRWIGRNPSRISAQYSANVTSFLTPRPICILRTRLLRGTNSQTIHMMEIMVNPT